MVGGAVTTRREPASRACVAPEFGGVVCCGFPGRAQVLSEVREPVGTSLPVGPAAAELARICPSRLVAAASAIGLREDGAGGPRRAACARRHHLV